MYPSARRSAESDVCRSWRGKSGEHRRSPERGDISKIAQAVSIVHAPATQKVTRHDHAVHFGRSLADALDAQLAVPALQRKLPGHAEPAEDLDTTVHHPPCRLGRVDLGDGGIDLDVVA